MLVVFVLFSTYIFKGTKTGGDEQEHEQSVSESARCYNLHANVASWKLLNCATPPVPSNNGGETQLVIPGKQLY